MVRFGRSRGCSSIWALFWAYVYSPHWVGTYFSDAAGPARSPPSLSGPTSWWYRGHKNLENYCPGLQVMPGLYSNSLLQRPTLGRTTLKNQDIRWSGNSVPRYLGRANLIPKEQALQPSLRTLSSSTQVRQVGVYPGRDENRTESCPERQSDLAEPWRRMNGHPPQQLGWTHIYKY